MSNQNFTSRTHYIMKLALSESNLRANKENISPNDYSLGTVSHSSTLENNLLLNNTDFVENAIEDIIDNIDSYQTLQSTSRDTLDNNMSSISHPRRNYNDTIIMDAEVAEDGSIIPLVPNENSISLEYQNDATRLSWGEEIEIDYGDYGELPHLIPVRNISTDHPKIAKEAVVTGEINDAEIVPILNEVNINKDRGEIYTNLHEGDLNEGESDSDPTKIDSNEDAVKLDKKDNSCDQKIDVNKKRHQIEGKRKLNQIKRLRGEKYESFKRIGYSEYIKVNRKGRCIGPKMCQHEGGDSVSTRSFMCGAFSEKCRQKLFNVFWNLESWDAKKAYIRGLVDIRPILKRRAENSRNESRKRNGYDFYLQNDKGMKMRVCKQFFLSTFDVSKDMIINWIQDKLDLSSSSANTSTEKGGKVKEHRKLNKKETQRREASKNQEAKKNTNKSTVSDWLKLLPKMPSHYCRSSTTKQYVESTFLSYRHMHEMYKEWCLENHKTHVERKAFMLVLNQENISIYHPRKDQCDICFEFSAGNISQEEYEIHKTKKDEAREAKQLAIKQCSEDTLVFTMDVQSILLCPKLLISKQYYKQKLQMHNFTIYVNNNRDVHCYVWHEGDGMVTSNEFTSCILHFLNQSKNFKKIIMISDGCAYQNKNRVLASALASFTTENPAIVIEQIILEKGHTMMEVDSVHSSLEHHFKPPIFVPSDYIDRMRQARKKQPFIIHHLDYSFFKNYENIPNNFISIRPGRGVGDPTVADIRALLYEKGQVFFKIRHSQEYSSLPCRKPNTAKTKGTIIQVQKLYTEPLKIEKSKFDALQSLKASMHKDNQLFYDNLSYK